MRWMFVTRDSQHLWLVVNEPMTSFTPSPAAHSRPWAAVSRRVGSSTVVSPASSAVVTACGASSVQHTRASSPPTGTGTPPGRSKRTPVGLAGVGTSARMTSDGDVVAQGQGGGALLDRHRETGPEGCAVDLGGGAAGGQGDGTCSHVVGASGQFCDLLVADRRVGHGERHGDLDRLVDVAECPGERGHDVVHGQLLSRCAGDQADRLDGGLQRRLHRFGPPVALELDQRARQLLAVDGQCDVRAALTEPRLEPPHRTHRQGVAAADVHHPLDGAVAVDRQPEIACGGGEREAPPHRSRWWSTGARRPAPRRCGRAPRASRCRRVCRRGSRCVPRGRWSASRRPPRRW